MQPKPSFTGTANKMPSLLRNAYGHVTPDEWIKVVKTCKIIMSEDWERSVHFDSICNQKFVLNLQDFRISIKYEIIVGLNYENTNVMDVILLTAVTRVKLYFSNKFVYVYTVGHL